MNILLDQNISFRVVKLLSNIFENVSQVKEVGLTDASDLEIWNYAHKHNYIIVTFDSDFIELATLKGYPPKVIWLRFGNSSNLKIANKLITKSNTIEGFLNNQAAAYLEID